jgi:hypothetical protein
MTDPLINARSAFGRTDGPPKHGAAVRNDVHGMIPTTTALVVA